MLPLATNPRGCPVCSGTTAQTLKVGRYYVLSRCTSCKALWDPKYETPPLTMYDQSYFSGGSPEHGYANYRQAMEINRLTFRHRLKRVKKLLGASGRILDVGCALGDFLEEAKVAGWNEAYGIDVSEFAVKTCVERGLQVSLGNLTHPPYERETFDVVFLQDVLEHTTDPVSELRSVLNLLKPGGMVFLTTPDTSSLSAKLLSGKWYHYKPGEHLTYFSRANIQTLLTRAGFERVQSKQTLNTMGLDYIFARLEPYQHTIFTFLRRIAAALGVANLPITGPIGELEAWGYRPMSVDKSNVIPLRKRAR